MKIKKFYLVTFVILFATSISFAAFATQDDKEKGQEKQAEKVKEIVADKTTHDFGTVSEDGGNVSTTFILTNQTDSAIVITNVSASCGCTTPSWTKTPIAPGKTGEVTATYKPKDRPGPFHKSITITTTGTPEKLTLFIKGTVE